MRSARDVLALLAVTACALAGCSGASRSVSTRPLTSAASTTTTTIGSTTAAPFTGSTGSAITRPPASTPTTIIRPTTLPLRTTTPAPNGAPALIPITSADSGKSVTMRVGDSVRLVLDDPAMQWTNLKLAPDGLLRPEPAPSPPPHGQLAIWTALRSGTVMVSAVGTAWCATGVACPMYARLFEVTLVIA